MKKGSLFIMVLSFGIFFLSPVSTLAADYQIDHMQIDAYLQKNGDVNVREKQLYTFNGEHNGMNRTLLSKKGTSIHNVEATEDGEKLEVKHSGDSYKIFQTGNDDHVPFTLNYTIKDGIERYQDMGQFYWPFYDSINESDYEQMEISVHPPEATDHGIALGYDTANVKTSQDQDGTVHYDLGKVKAGKDGDIRVAYDAALFPDAKHVKANTIKDKLKKAESKQLTKRMSHAKHEQFWHQLAPYISSFFLLIMLVVFISAWQKKRQRDLDLARFSMSRSYVPELEISMPALFAFKQSITLDANAMVASLLDLVRKGYVKQESKDTFTVVNRMTDFEHETILLHWLFDEVGKNGTFRFDDVSRYVDKYSRGKRYALRFDDWLQAVVAELKCHRMYEKVKKENVFVAIMSLMTIPFILIFIIYGINGWVAGLSSIMIGLGLFSFLHKPKTFLGKKITEEWIDFEARYPNLDIDEWQKLSDDAQKRACIYGIGMNSRKLNNQQKKWLKKTSNSALDRAALILYFTAFKVGYPIFYNAKTIAYAWVGRSGYRLGRIGRRSAGGGIRDDGGINGGEDAW